ncbi:helix-turn-helix domain-containing protein [Chitinophaga sp. SYP-B3965]|uniref:chromate resistance protein ChrB domain-containing protein n=1 Tax=Chitinophaga sp. SYP-B3965 TaxID=2663120 RepID=UPI0012999C6E|nr:chromate resistance protein ChrB domain-containing protein [Chitinophaga sp. SYP-B3965]MRG44923.1 helix-turn-helix domain-containing protein [Chitinophaga sp. SYP-B3965]
MKWISTQHPKIDSIACAWLILRFIDPEATFLFVPEEEVTDKAVALEATPFNVPGTELMAYKDLTTYDYLLYEYKLADPALAEIARIIKGADKDRHDLAPEAAGLWAIASGMAANIKDDQELLQHSLRIYDGLYTWAKQLKQVKHTYDYSSLRLMEVFHQFLSLKYSERMEQPQWLTEMKSIVQDQVDTNLTMDVKALSRHLDVNPEHLSREFSHYWDDLKFGEYMRKLRIEKALALIHEQKYTLIEIAYMTGFSDQGHFGRIFRDYTGKTPSGYLKTLPQP